MPLKPIAWKWGTIMLSAINMPGFYRFEIWGYVHLISFLRRHKKTMVKQLSVNKNDVKIFSVTKTTMATMSTLFTTSTMHTMSSVLHHQTWSHYLPNTTMWFHHFNSLCSLKDKHELKHGLYVDNNSIIHFNSKLLTIISRSSPPQPFQFHLFLL